MSNLFQIIGILIIGPVAVLAAVWLLVIVARRQVVAFTLGMVLTVLSLSHFGTSAMRLGLLLVLFPHLLRAIRVPRKEINLKLPTLLIPVIYVFVCFLSSVWSLAPFQTVLSASAWVVLLLFIFTFRSLLPASIIRRQIFYILLVAFFASIIISFTPLGWEAGRIQGIFNNANAVGIFTFLLIGTSLWMGKRYWFWIIPTGLIFVVLTGSRASLLAILVMLIVVLIGLADPKMKIPVVFIGAAVGGPLAFWTWQQIQGLNVDGSSVLRTNNSRESVWDLAIDFIQENPVLGAGYRATPEGIGSSSYFKLLAEFGFAFSGAGILLVLFYIWYSRFSIIMLGISFATLVNAIFEDWLLTAGAPMLVVYLMILFSIPQQHPDLNADLADSKSAKQLFKPNNKQLLNPKKKYLFQ